MAAPKEVPAKGQKLRTAFSWLAEMVVRQGQSIVLKGEDENRYLRSSAIECVAIV